MNTNLTPNELAAYNWQALSDEMAVAGDLPVLTAAQLQRGVEGGSIELFVATDEDGTRYVESFRVLD